MAGDGSRELTPLDISKCRDMQRKILARCRALADDGAHYLWAAEGEKPGEGPVSLQTPILDENRIKQTTFCAAAYGGCVCVGRLRAPGFDKMAPTEKVDNVPDTRTFIQANKANPGGQVGWESKKGLTPRLIGGYTGDNEKGAPKDYGFTNLSLVGKVVWGEGCDDTQHFDCRGLIRYVVKDVCGVPAVGVSSTGSGSSPLNTLRQPMARLVEAGETLLPADILCYGSDGHVSHICFADEQSNVVYRKGAQFNVVQAEDAVSGLNYGKSRSGDFKCIRLSPSTLLNASIKGQYPSTKGGLNT